MYSSTLCTVSYYGASSVRPSCSCSCYSPQLNSLNFPLSSTLSQLGSSHFTPWNGLRYLGISISRDFRKYGRRAKCRGKGVYASLFGVGAPEALVIGVVALLVFGPKGLAEVARNLGKTLRAFQPTIKELQDVSKEFKSTLEREIGLDDDPRSMRNTYDSNNLRSTPSSSVVEDFQSTPEADPNGSPSSTAYSSEEYLKITEEQLKAAAAVQKDVTSSLQESQPQSQPIVASSSPERPMQPETQPQASAASEKNDMPSPPENKIESDSQTEATLRETATIAPTHTDDTVKKPDSDS